MTTLQAILKEGAGRWIRNGREAREWSQLELTWLLREIGWRVTPRTIGSWELGATKVPAEALGAIERVFERYPPGASPTVGEERESEQRRPTGYDRAPSPLPLAAAA